MDINLLLASCKNKNLKDQKKLYEYTYQELFHVSLRYTQNQQDAEEVFNTAMLKVFKYISETTHDIQNYLGFCSRIIRLTAIDQYRHNLSTILCDTTAANYVFNDYFFDQTFGNIEVEEIFAIIQSLPHKERIVFSMFEIDGFNHREIGAELKINENHSKWLLHNAKKILKEKLTKQGFKSYKI